MKLCDAVIGRRVKVVKISGDLFCVKRIRAVGIAENDVLKVEKRRFGVIVSLNGRLLAMDDLYSRCIEVDYEDSRNG